MKCDACKEEHEKLYPTNCGLSLCRECHDDHTWEDCKECRYQQGFEAADYYHDMERDT